MGAISITGKSVGATSLKLTAGKITKTVPITVLSRNLLSYGPAEGNGLTATVNTDGSLHVTGAASRQWAGIRWTFPCPVHGAVTLSRPTSIDGLTVSVKCLDAKGGQLGAQINTGNAGDSPSRHRQPALRNPRHRGHTHREGRRPPNPVGIRHYRARLDATRQHEP